MEPNLSDPRDGLFEKEGTEDENEFPGSTWPVVLVLTLSLCGLGLLLLLGYVFYRCRKNKKFKTTYTVNESKLDSYLWRARDPQRSPMASLAQDMEDVERSESESESDYYRPPVFFPMVRGKAPFVQVVEDGPPSVDEAKDVGSRTPVPQEPEEIRRKKDTCLLTKEEKEEIPPLTERKGETALETEVAEEVASEGNDDTQRSTDDDQSMEISLDGGDEKFAKETKELGWDEPEQLPPISVDCLLDEGQLLPPEKDQFSPALEFDGLERDEYVSSSESSTTTEEQDDSRHFPDSSARFHDDTRFF